MDPTPGKLVHWMHKEIHTNKTTAKYSVSWLLLSIIAKLKVKENAGSSLDAKPSSDLGQSELGPLASEPPRKGKIM